MLDNFKFETFVDAHSNIFEEYLSSVMVKMVLAVIKFLQAGLTDMENIEHLIMQQATEFFMC